MYITFGGQPVDDANREAANLAASGWPSEIAGRANSFVCPLGEKPGRGWLLMRRTAINNLNLDAGSGLNLVFADNLGNTLTLKNLLFIKARRLAPGRPNDRNAPFLVEVADRRWLVASPFASGTPTQSLALNVRAPSAPNVYYSDTTASHVADSTNTWQQVVNSLWPSELSGGTPTLPFTPQGTPEGFAFDGVPMWRALNAVLDRIGCAVAYDPTADAFSIVRVGSPDANFSAAQTKFAARQLFDAEVIESNRGKIPATLYVFHPTWNRDRGEEATTESGNALNWRWGYNPANGTGSLGSLGGGQGYTAGGQTVDAALSGKTFARASLWDDLPAVVDDEGHSGAFTNASNITSRDAERVSDFKRLVEATYFRRVYTGYLLGAGTLPGSQLSAAVWSARAGEGPRTEFIRVPMPFVHPGDAGSWGDDHYVPILSNLQGRELVNSRLPLGYPDLVQLVTVANATAPVASSRGAAHNVFQGNVLRYQYGQLVTGESCWLVDLAGANLLTVGSQYHGRLIGIDTATPSGGMSSTWPRYAINSGAVIAGPTNINNVLSYSVNSQTSFSVNQADLVLNSYTVDQRFTSSANVNIYSIVSYFNNGSNGTKNEFYIITNVGSNTITFVNDDGSHGTAGYRFMTSTGSNVAVGPKQTIELLYDTVTDRYRVIGGSALAGGATSPLTTKGDIWCYTTTDARQPVGADGTLLTGDSTQSSGLNYKTPAAVAAAGGLPLTVKITINWNDAGMNVAATTATIPFYNLPSGSIVLFSEQKHTTQFTGMALLTFGVGVSGSQNRYGNSYNGTAAVTDPGGSFQTITYGPESFAGSTQINVYVSGSANLNTLAAGVYTAELVIWPRL